MEVMTSTLTQHAEAATAQRSVGSSAQQPEARQQAVLSFEVTATAYRRCRYSRHEWP